MRHEGGPYLAQPRGPDALRAGHGKRLRRAIGSNAAPVAILKVLAQGQTRQGVQGVVEVQDQLGPLHADDVLVGRGGQPGQPHPRRRLPAARADHDGPVAGLPERAGIGADDVEPHHSRRDTACAHAPGERFNVAEAVLKAHHERGGGSVRRDGLGRALGVGALGADEDRVGLGEPLGAGEAVGVWANLPRRAVGRDDGQAAVKAPGRAVAADEDHAFPARGEHPSDIAADSACAQNRDHPAARPACRPEKRHPPRNVPSSALYP